VRAGAPGGAGAAIGSCPAVLPPRPSLVRSIAVRTQQTIARPARVVGVGYWSGRAVEVEFHPAPVNTGVVFVRRDLSPKVRIPARIAYRTETPRRTVLAVGQARVEMVEHVMAALAGLQINNCEIYVTAAEMPGLDGSSQPLVDALLKAGIHQQHAPRERLVVKQTLRLGNDSTWVAAEPPTGDGLRITSHIDYSGVSAIGRQTTRLEVTPESFAVNLASARTFVLEEEARMMRSQGLGDHLTYGDLLVFGEHGPIDNQLRYEDECVRHKALDVIGDLALAGCDLVADITAHCGGHRLNAELVDALLRAESSPPSKRSIRNPLPAAA